ncbi:MAG: hypothetical protein IJU37_10550 [Desulfovibrio sp.]|nr:hypothetical protein [Desulfovibrio sp.]
MSQVQIHPHPPIQNVNIPQAQNVPNAQVPGVQNAQPHANVPPEMQNARPARGRIFARVAAFFVGAGVGGGTTFGLGGGTLASSLIGAGATAAVGGTGVVTALATGGAALIGGALGLGFFAGIRALVNRFRRAPDPEPQVQNQPQNQPQNPLPHAQPAADFTNTNVAKIFSGTSNAALPASLQQAADNAVARMRDIYGEQLAPQGATLRSLLDFQGHSLSQDIRALDDTLTPAKMDELVEKHMRLTMARTAVKNALVPLCPAEERNILCTYVAQKHPELMENLSKANTMEEVQNLLAGAADEINAMVQIHQQAGNLFAGATAQSLSTIAQSLGLEVEAITPFVNTVNWESQLQKLQKKVDLGTVAANAMTQEFNKLAENRARAYTDAFTAVDAAPNLSAECKTAMKMEILTSPDLPKAEHFHKGIAAGQQVDATALKEALDAGSPPQEVRAILVMLGQKIGTALQQEYGPEGWAALVNDSPGDVRATQGAAFMAMLDTVPGLREALSQRQDLNIHDEMNAMQLNEPDASIRAGAMLVKFGYGRLTEMPLSMQDFATMQAQSQILNTIRQADIPQELKTSWCAKVVSGAIANMAMAQALIANVPQLAPETRPIMESFILMQSYDPHTATVSAQKAQAFAQEMADWRNFNTAEDPDMAPVANYIQQDITSSLYGGQQFDNHGISSQLKLDAPRGDYTINGEVLHYTNANAVAGALRRAMPTEQATKLVSALINQSSFAVIYSMGMQMNKSTGGPLPNEVQNSMAKMASCDVQQHGGVLLIDMSNAAQGEKRYKVTVQNGRANIEMSNVFGLNGGLGIVENGTLKYPGKARYTLHFECNLLGQDGQSPSIESVHLQQEFVPVA